MLSGFDTQDDGLGSSMSKLPFSSLLSLLLSVALATTLHAKSQEDIAVKQVKASLKGKVLTLRHIYSDDSLIFDDQFKLVKGGTPGRWTLDGLVKIQKVSLKGRKYVIEGKRIHQKYDPKDKQLGRYRSTRMITVELPTSSADGRPVDLRLFMQNVFLKTGELYPDDLPPYWKPYLTCVRDNHPDCNDPNNDWYTRGYPPMVKREQGMTYPLPTHREEPEYTEDARKAKLNGMIIFLAAIDKEGNLHSLELIRPLGLGLDESAAEKLSQWKYSPATQDGQPVDVRLNIEIHFYLR
jgi:TonB family protein